MRCMHESVTVHSLDRSRRNGSTKFVKFHEEKESLINEALAVMEIDRRAEESGKSGDEIAAELFSAEQPSDEAVTAFYEENKSRINQPLDAIKPQIIQLLTQQEQAKKQQTFLAELKEKTGSAS